MPTITLPPPRILVCRSILAALGLTVLLPLAGAEEASKVIAYRGNQIPIFEEHDGRFKRVASVKPAELPSPPVPVLRESSKGYVKIARGSAEIWLDATDVTIMPSKRASTSGCAPTLGGSLDKVIVGSLGSGEKGCSPK